MEQERESKAKVQVAARRLLDQFNERTQGDIYLMLQGAHLFTDLFLTDPLGGGAKLARGDAAALRRTHHKVLARIHPDRHTGSALNVRVQAEELFKTVDVDGSGLLDLDEVQLGLGRIVALYYRSSTLYRNR